MPIKGSIAEGIGKQARESPYFGGDFREFGQTHLAHVAIAGQGTKLSDVKGLAIQSVLAATIGKGLIVILSET